jgi:hypothetical protein
MTVVVKAESPSREVPVQSARRPFAPAATEDHIMRIALLGLGLALLATTACTASSKPATVEATTLRGTAALSSYPATPRTIEATDEAGRATRTAIAADGSFDLRLRRSHTYRIAVLTDAGPFPLVFPRTSGKVTTTFALKSDGARLALGQVHYVHVPSAAPSQARLVRASAVRTASLGGAAGSEANDADDNQEVSCGDGSHGEGQSSADMEEADDQAGSDGDVSIAEHNVPENVDGCGIDETDGENNESGEKGGHESGTAEH